MRDHLVQLLAITTGGFRWQLPPECRERLLGPEGLRLEEWLHAGQAQVVKHGPHRTVYRVALPDLCFYLKHYRMPDLRSWLRQLIRPAKARLEYERALAVAARNVPTVVPLALGERPAGSGPRESFLLTRSLENAEPLNTFLERTLPQYEHRRQVGIRHRLAWALGAFVARLHDAGIAHHDLHSGNILIRLDAQDQAALHLIDLHAVRLGRPLAWPASRANLSVLNRWFILRASRADRYRFWRAYCQARQAFASVWPEEGARELEARTWESNLRFWRHRDRRCLRLNRYYGRVQASALVGYAVRDLDPTALANLLAAPDAPFAQPGVRLLKDSRSSTVAEFDMPINGVVRRVIYKRFRVTAWSDPWLALVRSAPALRSWYYGHGLRERCLPTPRPLAVFHRRRWGLACEGYLLTEKIPDAVNLHSFVLGLDSLSPEVRWACLRRCIDQVARLLRELHRRQLSHRDLKAANLLVARPENASGATAPGAGPRLDLWLIDLVGVQLYRHLPRPRRVQNLARLHASFVRTAGLTRTDKLRFLRCYFQWGLFGRSGWKRWWREIEQATAVKVARNARSGRPLH